MRFLFSGAVLFPARFEICGKGNGLFGFYAAEEDSALLEVWPLP